MPTHNRETVSGSKSKETQALKDLSLEEYDRD